MLSNESENKDKEMYYDWPLRCTADTEETNEGTSKVQHDKSYFLKSSRSKVRPSSVFFRDALRVSIHSFSLGSPVLSPVALSA